MCKLIILTSGIVALAYGTEFFVALYSADMRAVRLQEPRSRPHGVGLLVSCNVLVPQLLWFAAVQATGAGLRHHAVRQRRDVVRTFRDRGHVAPSRLPSSHYIFLTPTK